MELLRHLELWLTDHLKIITDTCVSAIAPEDTFEVAYLAQGFVARMGGGGGICATIEYWSDCGSLEETQEEIQVETDQNRRVAKYLHDRIADRTPKVAAFLQAWADLDVPMPGQESLF